MSKNRFEQEYAAFMSKHRKEAKGDRLMRLEDHGKLERLLLEMVLWPLLGSLENLYPEYEVMDFKDGDRFLDYALLLQYDKVCIEGDGFGPHHKNMTRWQFNDERNRQNDLVIDDWIVLRFTYDDIVNNPRKCQMKLQQLLGKLMIDRGDGSKRNGKKDEYCFLERAVIRYAAYNNRLVTPTELEMYLNVGRRKVRSLLEQLVEKEVFAADTSGVRVRRYRLILPDTTQFLRI